MRNTNICPFSKSSMCTAEVEWLKCSILAEALSYIYECKRSKNDMRLEDFISYP